MVNYVLKPAGAASDTVKLPGHSLAPIPRRQTHQAERHDNITGGVGATADGLQPGDIKFDGYWWGANAEDIAVEFRDKISDDISVDRVDVQAVDDAGNNVSSPYNGTYVIADNTEIGQTDPNSPRGYRYQITLIED